MCVDLAHKILFYVCVLHILSPKIGKSLNQNILFAKIALQFKHDKIIFQICIVEHICLEYILPIRTSIQSGTSNHIIPGRAASIPFCRMHFRGACTSCHMHGRAESAAGFPARFVMEFSHARSMWHSRCALFARWPSVRRLSHARAGWLGRCVPCLSDGRR